MGLPQAHHRSSFTLLLCLVLAESLQTDALNHLEQCLEKETRQARSQLERTLEDYLGWCSEWDLPCLPVFSLVAALHIYDGSVDAHDKSELTAKDLRSRRRWLSNLSWIADRANPYFQAINTHKAGADFIGPLILGDAVQEITQMDAEGQYWEDKLEPQYECLALTPLALCTHLLLPLADLHRQRHRLLKPALQNHNLL